MDHLTVAGKAAELSSKLGDALDSMYQSGMLETLINPDRDLGTLEKAVGGLDGFSKASTAFAGLGVVLQVGLAIAGAETPEEKMLKMISSLSQQMTEFQDLVLRKINELSSENKIHTSQQQLFDHVNNIESYLGDTDRYWKLVLEGTNHDAIKLAESDVANIDYENKLRPAFNAIHTFTAKKGLVSALILDQVYAEKYGGDEVITLGNGLLRRAGEVLRIEAACMHVRCKGQPELQLEASSEIEKVYGDRLDEISAAVKKSFESCINIDKFKLNWKTRAGYAFWDGIAKNKNWQGRKKETFTAIATHILNEMKHYSWMECAVAVYDGFTGWNNHGLRFSAYEPADHVCWFGCQHEDMGDLAVNVVVYFMDKNKPYLGLPDGTENKLQEVVDTMLEPGHTELESSGGYMGSSFATTEPTPITDVHPYLTAVSQVGLVTVHLVRNISNPCFLYTAPKRITIKTGPVFTGFCFA